MANHLPPIVMTWREHARLSYLAGLVWSEFPEFSNYLKRELDRTRLVAPERIGLTTVRIGSCVEFVYLGSGLHEVVTLVFPPDEDMANGKMSVLTPVGAALIGLMEGQSIDFCTLQGEKRALKVLKVHPPEKD